MGTAICSTQKQTKDPRRKLTQKESNDLIASLSQLKDAKTALRLNKYSVCQIISVFQPLLKKKSSKQQNLIGSNKMISKLNNLLDIHELATDSGKHVTQIDFFIALAVMETYIVMNNPSSNMDLRMNSDYFRERIEFLYQQFNFQDLNRQHDKSLEGMIDTLIKCETALFPWVDNISNFNYAQERTIIANVIGIEILNILKDLSLNF